MRQVATPLLPKDPTPAEDISLAVREVASYFPALIECESDVIKFLSKKIKAFLKQQRHLLRQKTKKNEQDPVKKSVQDPNPQNGTPKESGQVDVHIPPNDPSVNLGSPVDRAHPPHPEHLARTQKESVECNADTQPNAKSGVTEPVLSGMDASMDLNPEPLVNSQGDSGQFDADTHVNDTKARGGSAFSPRKRTLANDHYNFDDIPVLSPVKPFVSKSKKAKVSSKPTPPAENVGATDMKGKEFSSQNSCYNVKFEVGHFVVLGEDIDEYHFCQIDNIEYHKSSAKYHMSITYFKLVDGRLEVWPDEKDPEKPWTDKKVPLNTVILNLRHSRLIDTEMVNKITEITREIYS